MPHMDLFNKIDDKLDTVQERIARVESVMDQWQINIQRFYDKDMGPLIVAVTDNQKSIAKMEVELAKLKTKIAIWGSVAVFITSISVNLIMKVLHL